jgi:hypothetical protein
MTGYLADPALARSIEERTLLARKPELTEIDGPLLFLASDASSDATASRFPGWGQPPPDEFRRSRGSV